MYFRRKILFIIAGSLFLVSHLVAQENLRTIEDFYLSTDVEIQLLRSQVISNYRSSKLTALSTIRQMQKNGDVAVNEDATLVILDALASTGIDRKVMLEGRVVNDFPEVRRQAVYILGDIGGEQAQRILLDVLKNETESTVVAEAIHALGRTDESTEEVIIYVTSILQRNSARSSPDNNIALACISAIRELEVISPDAFTALINVANGAYSSFVRNAAWDFLTGLREAS